MSESRKANPGKSFYPITSQHRKRIESEPIKTLHNTYNVHKSLENACERVMTAFRFAFDWLKNSDMSRIER